MVTGPWLAGVTGVVAALSEQLPKQKFVESADLEGGEAPTVVVFVVSAAATLTESDCALLDASAAETDEVIGVVSKIDVHRNWEEVLAGDREVLGSHASRYRDVPWVGVAAAPESGEPGSTTSSPRYPTTRRKELPRRNRLRAWNSRLQTIAGRYDRDADGAGRRARVDVLRDQRSAILRQRRLSKSERTIALRSQTQQARVQLSYFARNRCASVRSELQEDAASLTQGKAAGVRVQRGCAPQRGDHRGGRWRDHTFGRRRAGTGPDDRSPAPAPLPTIDLPAPQLKSRKLETRLMMLVGAGFGLGVALTSVGCWPI